jgi:photosystem II stability/assembly factor-like uncharacterized protein
MRKKTQSTLAPLARIGALEAGMVTALAIGDHDGPCLFAGTPVGVYRSPIGEAHFDAPWERCPGSPTAILSLAVSPTYAQNHTLWAGTGDGVFVSHDGGESWAAASMAISGAAVIALVCSPNFAEDGLLLAGTVEDGILYSDTRGETWQNKSFGLLDATVMCLAFSPGVANDGTVFAGSDTTLYYSYNRALAWKVLPVPDALVPALSLLVSPRFETDKTVFLGSEQQGLYRSTDQGASWQKLDLPANSINALLHGPDGDTLAAATEAGIFKSTDGGDTWQRWLEEPDAICLAGQGPWLAAGTAEHGAWSADGQSEWQAMANLPARAVHGLTLSPRFGEDPLAFMFGPQDGIWRTSDGGQSWGSLEALPGSDIAALAASPQFAKDRTLAAASPSGLMVSGDAGSSWRIVSQMPASQAAFSPDGKRLAAAFAGLGIKTSNNLGADWQSEMGPWDGAGQIDALAISNSGQLYVGWREAGGATLSLWQGTSGQFEQVLSQPAGENPVIRLFIPTEPIPHRPWFASLGGRVWTLSARKGQAALQAEVFSAGDARENIVSLTGLQSQGSLRLLAATGQHLYQSTDGKDWTKIYDFGAHPVVAMTLPPNFSQDNTVYVLLLGGVFARAVIA